MNVTLIVLLVTTFVDLFPGSTVFMVGAVLSVVNVLVHNAILLPDKSVKLLECMITVYLVALVRLLVGVIVNTFPLMDLVSGTVFPLLFFSSIHPFPFLMDSLNVTLITLLTATLVALFAGSMLFIVGAVKSVGELVALTVALAADTLLKIGNSKLKTIIIAKNNFTLILPPPCPKTTPTKFYNLILCFF